MSVMQVEMYYIIAFKYVDRRLSVQHNVNILPSQGDNLHKEKMVEELIRGKKMRTYYHIGGNRYGRK